MTGVWLACGGMAHASARCEIREITGMNFGRYDPLSPEPLTTAGTVTLCCEELGPSDFVSLDLSPGSAQSASGRAMTQGTGRLAYNIYMDRGFTRVWGDGFAGTAHHGPLQPPSGTCSSIPIYGYMPAGQPVLAGSYSDTLTLTLTLSF